METKLDKSEYQDHGTQLEKMLAKVYNDLDTKAGSLQVIERFVDVYVPIRMQQQIGETLKAVLPDNLVKKLESVEIEKFKKLNMETLTVESNSNLKKLSQNTANELNALIKDYRKQAKAAGRMWKEATQEKSNKNLLPEDS